MRAKLIRFLERTIQPTLRAIAKTGNKWRSRDRLWLDGGSGGWDIPIGRWLGLIEPKGYKGHYVIGPPSDMVKLTPKGVEVEKRLRELTEQQGAHA